MTRKDPNPMTANQVARGIAAGQHLPALAAEVAAADRLAAASGYQPGQPIDDQYRQRTYQALLARGEPVADAQRKAEFWARLKASSRANVHGPGETVDELIAQWGGDAASVSVLPTGYQPQAAATSLPARGPPTMLEYTSNQWIGMSTPVNRFSLNPGREYYSAIPGDAPSMFGAGDLPILTGSGVDPSILRWVAWPIRHAAAFAESRSTVAQLVELSLEGDPEGWPTFVSAVGRDGLNAYWAKIATWVQTLPTDEDGIQRAATRGRSIGSTARAAPLADHESLAAGHRFGTVCCCCR